MAREDLINNLYDKYIEVLIEKLENKKKLLPTELAVIERFLARYDFGVNPNSKKMQDIKTKIEKLPFDEPMTTPITRIK